MKILILTNYDVGLYKFRKELLEEFLKEHDVYICLPDGEYISALKELGCKYIPCEFNRRGMNPLAEIQLILSYRKIIRKVNPDIVFTYTIKPNSYGGAICAKKGIPYVANITGLGTSIENGGSVAKLTLALYRYGLRKAQKVFFQNTYNYQFMLKKGIVGKNCSILPGSGVNLQENSFEKYPSEENGIRFLFVGRIMKDKGIEEFLYCAKQIKRKHPNCYFDIVGGYDEEQYHSIVQEYESKGIVKGWGQQSDVHSIIKSHHIMVQPSYHEGLSNVLLEAAACGRPVVATNIPGCRETFDEGISGIGFEAHSGDSLVNAVEKILALSTEEREKMGIAGREKVEREFNRKIVIDFYLDELRCMKTK